VSNEKVCPDPWPTDEDQMIGPAYEVEGLPLQQCITIEQLNNYITQWVQGSPQIKDMMDAIIIWKRGC
jgi:hypothetical protein